MLSHCAEQGGEVAARLRCFGMVRSKRLLTNLQRASVPVSRLFVVALSIPKPGEAVHGLSRIGMLRSPRLFEDMQRARKVGERVLIAQELAPPLPNRTCGLSPHTALTESPTFF
jgi:hypothetical protein